ncbi:hypothetical protein ACFWN1_14655 [Streptomyces sp. NPDC058459]|uniref:hypothetical protein n=1 Tax=Streptomyces sp. NPDC058459 TaxID=3346508 RepID=UPI0036545FAA
MTGQLYVIGDDGAWHEVPGVTSVEFNEQQPDGPPDDEYWRLHDARDSLRFMWAAVAGVRAAAQLRRSMQQLVDQVDEAASHAGDAYAKATARTRPDRPAWQSPYGPGPRRR